MYVRNVRQEDPVEPCRFIVLSIQYTKKLFPEGVHVIFLRKAEARFPLDPRLVLADGLSDFRLQSYDAMEIGYAHAALSLQGSEGDLSEAVTSKSLPRSKSGGLIVLTRQAPGEPPQPIHSRSYSWSSMKGDSSIARVSLEELKRAVFRPIRQVNLASPMPLRRREASARHGGRPQAATAACSPAEAALRIAVDADSGQAFFVERSAVCDACPFCEDVCEVAGCKGCDERRGELERSYGSAVSSHVANAEESQGSDSEDAGSSVSAQSLFERYPRKQTYTLCEVRRRRVTGACWVVSRGTVYDVTDALPDHPGGKSSILRNAGGRDCEEDFLFHSKPARKLWRQYRVGNLVDCAGREGGSSPSRGGDCVIA